MYRCDYLVYSSYISNNRPLSDGRGHVLAELTIGSTVIWATNQVGDNQLGDTLRSSGRHESYQLGNSIGSVLYR